jgi:hypothetical protein
LAYSGFPAGGPPQAFLRVLRRQDRDLEAYWHPIRERWILYRVVRRGAVPCEDVLLKELEVSGPHGEYRPLGMWLIDWLRQNDKTAGGSVDPLQANRAAIRKMEEDDKSLEKEKEKTEDAMCSQFGRDCETHVVRGRKSTVMPKARRTK